MKTLIKQAKVVNEGKVWEGDVLIHGKWIEKMGASLSESCTTIDANGKYLLPGLIDDQVHFREPGLTHKGTIQSESRAAVAGGVTSFMEMPNTQPPVLTQSLLEDKYQIAAKNSLANYSFYMGTSVFNYDDIMKTDLKNVCGLKIFLGSSTGNLVVEDEKVLDKIFENFSGLIAVHAENDALIKQNAERLKKELGEHASAHIHPRVRTEEACYDSSARAVARAKKFNTRLHVLHLSTAKELALFDASKPLAEKRITAEACLHHLWFCESDYDTKGNFIKWNPAIKTEADREAIRQAVNNNVIDVLATDHAPHTREEKMQPYWQAPSGGPLLEWAVPAWFALVKEKIFSLEKIVEKACHNPATLFRMDKRGFIREGYYADLVLVDDAKPFTVTPHNIVTHCQWSPFENTTFPARVEKTWVSGQLAYDDGKFFDVRGERLAFKN